MECQPQPSIDCFRNIANNAEEVLDTGRKILLKKVKEY